MSTWDEFATLMQGIEDARNDLNLRSHQECFYRGHRDTAYNLLPSLFRQSNRTHEEYRKLERRMFFEFRNRARQLYGADISDWDVLFHMQHHGVPTRLLDWTSVFGVALYFALLNYGEEAERPPCIWIMNPYALNHANWGLYRLFSPKYLARDEGDNRSYDYGELLLGTHPPGWNDWLSWNTPIAMYSYRRSERMLAQSGLFTIHGTNISSINEMFHDRPDVLRKIEVPKGAIPAGRQFLAFAGISHRQLFPDLDGLARSVCEKFGVAIAPNP